MKIGLWSLSALLGILGLLWLAKQPSREASFSVGITVPSKVASVSFSLPRSKESRITLKDGILVFHCRTQALFREEAHALAEGSKGVALLQVPSSTWAKWESENMDAMMVSPQGKFSLIRPLSVLFWLDKT